MFGKKTLPAVRSLLDERALLDAARKHYPIGRDATCELMQRGLNDTYRIASPDGEYALRVYRAGWRSDSEIRWELSLLQHLKQNQAPVAAPVATRAGNSFCIVAAPEGLRHAALFEYAQGKECLGEAMTVERARAYGRGAAAIHLRMDTFEADFPRFEIDLHHLLLQPLTALEPRMTQRSQDLAELRHLAQRLRDTIVEIDARGLTRAVCHGDLQGGNANLGPDNEFTFYDFDRAGSGWRAYDLATFRWGMLRSLDRRKADERWRAFLEGYREVRGIPKVDESAVHPFVAAREIWVMGLHAATVRDVGYAFMHDRYFDRSMTFLKDWEAERHS
jgi:Ser/Thr protein kinase RdoA (MazF antagonist)